MKVQGNNILDTLSCNDQGLISRLSQSFTLSTYNTDGTLSIALQNLLGVLLFLLGHIIAVFAFRFVVRSSRLWFRLSKVQSVGSMVDIVECYVTMFWTIGLVSRDLNMMR